MKNAEKKHIIKQQIYHKVQICWKFGLHALFGRDVIPKPLDVLIWVILYSTVYLIWHIILMACILRCLLFNRKDPFLNIVRIFFFATARKYHFHYTRTLVLSWTHMKNMLDIWQRNILSIPDTSQFICLRENGRDLTQSYEKSPFTNKNSKKQSDNTKTPPKTSITQRLRTVLGRSVGVTFEIFFIVGADKASKIYTYLFGCKG